MVCMALTCQENICSGKTREGWPSRWERTIGELTGEEREPAEDRHGSWGGEQENIMTHGSEDGMVKPTALCVNLKTQ